MTKTYYRVIYPENPKEPPQILFGEQAKQYEEHENLIHQINNYTTRYSGAVAESAFRRMVPWFEELQGERIIYASQGFRPQISPNFQSSFSHSITGPLHLSNNNNIIRSIIFTHFIDQGVEYIFNRLGGSRFKVTIIKPTVKAPDFIGESDPITGIKINSIEIGADVKMFINEHPQIPTDEAMGRCIASTIGHEITHMNQLMGDSTIATQARKLNEDISRAYRELNGFLGHDSLEFDHLSVKDVEEKLVRFINYLKKQNPSLAADLKIKNFPIKSFSNIFFSSDKTLRLLLFTAVWEWLRKPATRFSLGLAGMRALKHWEDSANVLRKKPFSNILAAELEAYALSYKIESTNVKNFPNKYEVYYDSIDGNGNTLELMAEKHLPHPLSFDQIKDPYSNSLIRYLEAAANNPRVVFTARGIGIAGDITAFGMDWYIFYTHFQGVDGWQNIKNGTRAMASTVVVGADTITYLTKALSLIEAAGNIGGAVAAGVNFLTHAGQAFDDFDRTEVSMNEKILITTSAMGYGASFGTLALLGLGMISSGGLLIPVLIFGGMIVGTAAGAGHAEAQKERVSDDLVTVVKEFAHSQERSTDQRIALEKLAKILADENGELTDDAFMDFFELIENDRYFKQNFRQILSHPTLAPL